MEIPTKAQIKRALVKLRISTDPQLVRIKGLRTVVYMYILHGDKESAMKQCKEPFFTANRQLSECLPQEYHTKFTEVVKEHVTSRGLS